VAKPRADLARVKLEAALTGWEGAATGTAGDAAGKRLRPRLRAAAGGTGITSWGEAEGQATAVITELLA